MRPFRKRLGARPGNLDAGVPATIGGDKAQLVEVPGYLQSLLVALGAGHGEVFQRPVVAPELEGAGARGKIEDHIPLSHQLFPLALQTAVASLDLDGTGWMVGAGKQDDRLSRGAGTQRAVQVQRTLTAPLGKRVAARGNVEGISFLGHVEDRQRLGDRLVILLVLPGRRVKDSHACARVGNVLPARGEGDEHVVDPFADGDDRGEVDSRLHRSILDVVMRIPFPVADR